MNTTSQAYMILEDLIEEGIVSLTFEHRSWALKWHSPNAPHSRIFLIAKSIHNEDYDDSMDAFYAFYEAGRMNSITVYSGLPEQLVDTLKAWKKMWKGEKREKEEEHYNRYNFNTEV